MNKPPPTFDRSFLRELAGGVVFRGGERLFESHAVEAAQWDSPVLHGKVRGKGVVYEPELNLRSTVFADNRCQCPDGTKRKVCAHAVAAALHFEASKQEREHFSEPMPADDEGEPETTEPAARLRSIRTSDQGPALRVLVFLPPNFEEAAQRDAVVLKIDAAAGREIVPLNRLSPTKVYQVAPPQERALLLIEQWCGGKLASLLQLTRPRLRELLAALEGEPAVYWVKRPNEPIDWVEGKLPAVHEHLSGGPEVPEEAPAEAVDPAERPAFGAGPRRREPAKANPRRRAESQRKPLFQSRPADYPSAVADAGAMDAFPAHRVVVDGSPNFLAVRLPVHDDSIQPLREILKKAGFLLEPSNRKWWLRDRHKTLNFLAAHWRELKERWQVAFTDNFEKKFAGVELIGLEVEAREAGDGFAIDISLGGQRGERALRQALAGGKHYVEPADEEAGGGGGAADRITLLDRGAIERLHRIERAVSGQADRPFTPTFSRKLSTAELVDVEDLVEEACEGWQPPQAWQSRSRALKQVGALEPAPVEPEFDARLRTYQRIGVAWLWHLYRHDLGGILADEMGLGKTLQALALIQCIRAQGEARGPALVVCPASLVENWLREAARFTPALRCHKQHGPKRPTEPLALEDADLVITSYGTLRQDSELLSTLDWSVVVGDEAQHIKNRRSRNARSLTRLRAAGRFLLTGTPVENSLDDLLSLFAFLMPGYLGKAPPQLSQEDRAWHGQRQLERAAAYILRRTKQEVAPELPGKIEKTFYCELGDEQSRFYQETLEKTRRELFDMEMSGAHEGRVKFAAFKELLRLRQVCVDPRILDEGFEAAHSAKLAAFDEVLDECLDNGSRILVFSSFVSALKLLAEHLETNGHPFCYLDGQTRNRLEVCDRFNADASIPVFLISLKAGGTGLNLTGADTVVHYDPWWNPAAEAQATDRAHRIGQERVVTSIKLIAAGTVEEKVLEMQARKAELLAQLFEESSAANAQVGIDDIRDLLS